MNNTEIKVAEHIKAVMELLELPVTESNKDTNTRIAKMLCSELFVNRNNQNIEKLNEKMKLFPNLYDSEMIIVKDIECNTTCFTSKTPIKTSTGTVPIKDIKAGEEVLTFDENLNLVKAKVSKTFKHRVNQTMSIQVENHRRLSCTPEHPFFVKYKGWVEAEDLKVGDKILCLNKGKDLFKSSNWDFTINDGFSFGYCLGVVASDGSTWRNQVRLEVNDYTFAKSFCKHLKKAFNIDAEVTKSKYSSGFTPNKRECRYLVRVISGYLVDYLKEVFGGSTRSCEFLMPEMILNSYETFRGFIEGYFMGDGTCYKAKYIRLITKNGRFADEISEVLGTKYYYHKDKDVYDISVPLHLLNLHKKEINKEKFIERFNKEFKNEKPIVINPFVKYEKVISIKLNQPHSVDVYNFEVEKYHTYLAGDMYVHNCEHHWLPFTGKVTVAYIPGETVIGLSKIPRVVKYFSKKPQLQEQITEEIGNYLYSLLKPIALFVEMESVHECVKCRGAESNCSTKTFFKRGNKEQLDMYYRLRK